MGMYAALGISASGLAAERLRMDVIANNLANADSTNGVGDAYHRKAVMMAEPAGRGRSSRCRARRASAPPATAPPTCTASP